MWWKLPIALFLLLVALRAEKKLHSVTTFYKIEMDSTSMTRSLCDQWEAFYASQGIKFGRVVFAQYTWETDFGQSKIFKENHNGYGMKYRKLKNPLHQIALGEKNGHAYYKCHAQSVKDYARWQRRLLRARPDVDTEEEYLQLLKQYKVPWCYNCSYAEDTTYVEKIKARMDLLAAIRN